MSHVDEGALHAYLDGALDEYPAAEARRVREHLDGCAECAERLEAERAPRSDAHAMLGMAAPAVELPSFEDLRAYVERTRPAPSRMSIRVVRLSWAASVMLALGVGWALRGGRMEPIGDSSGAPTAELDGSGSVLARGEARDGGSTASAAADGGLRSVTDMPSETIDPDAFDARADLPTTSVVSASEAAPETGEEAVAVVGSDADGPSRPAEQALGSDATVSTAVSELDVVASAERSLGVDAVAAPLESSVPEAAVFAESAAGGMDATAVAGTVADASVVPPVAEADIVAAAEPEEEEARPERRRSESPTAFTSQFSAARGGVRIVPEDDDRFEDEPLQSVPGFEVVLTENVGDGREFVGTVTTQRLENEDMMQVFLLEPEVGLEVLPGLNANLNEVRVQAETGWVVLRGPRSEDELETLLMRLFPG